MQNMIKKWLVTNLITTLALTGLITSVFTSQTAQALDISIGYGQNSTQPTQNLKILTISTPSATFDPWDDQKFSLDFVINKAASVTYEVFNDDNEKVRTINKETPFEKGNFTLNWNGKDDFGQVMDQNEYSYKLKVKSGIESDSETGKIKIKKGFDNTDVTTQDARIKNAYITKDSFDPGLNEKEYIVFTLTSKSDVQVTIYDKDDKKVIQLLNEQNKQPGTYQVLWDGEEAIKLKGKQTYTYRIYAQNVKGQDIKSGKIITEKDDTDSQTPNVYKDSVDQIIYTPKNNQLNVNFKLEKAGTVTVDIRLGSKTIARVADSEELTEGSQSIYWNGLDQNGQVAEDGIYNYKITAKNIKGKNVEEGTFSVANSTSAKYGTTICSGFTDLAGDFKYCEAIQWAVGAGVFQGYNDGTFRAYQPITRAEALKVVLQTLKVQLLSVNADKFSFSDVNGYCWFSSYVKTGLALGIIKGYGDGTFKPDKTVIRAEALVMLLNTARSKDNIIIPSNNVGQPYYDTIGSPATNWYMDYVWFAKSYSLNDNETYFYPGAAMTRGDMADMLYRYHKSAQLMRS